MMYKQARMEIAVTMTTVSADWLQQLAGNRKAGVSQC